MKALESASFIGSDTMQTILRRPIRTLSFVEDRFAIAPVIKRRGGATPIVGVVALEQMGFRVDPVTGRLIKGLPLML